MQFGATTTSLPAASGGLVLNLSTTKTSAVAPSFGFGTSLGLSKSNTVPTFSTSTLGSSISKPATTGVTGLGFSLTSTTTGTTTSQTTGFTFASATNKGLGGLDPSAFNTSTSSSASTQGPAVIASSEAKAIKDAEMPNEVKQLVANYRNYIKAQRQLGDENAQLQSSKQQISQITESIQTLRSQLSQVMFGFHKLSAVIDELKIGCSEELKNATMAKRTHDIPLSHQQENTAPLIYFAHKLDELDGQIEKYRLQISELEFHTSDNSDDTHLSPQEMLSLIQRMHDTFIRLVSNLQPIHEHVQRLKQMYISLKLSATGTDDSGQFVQDSKQSADEMSVEWRAGPSPFARVGDVTAGVLSGLMQQQQKPGLFTGTTASTGLGGFGTASTGFGTGSLSSTGSLFKPATGGFGASTGFGTTGGAGLFGSGTTGGAFGGFGSTANTGFGFGATTTTSAATGSIFGKPAQTGFGSFGASTAGTGTLLSTTGSPFSLTNPPGKKNKGKLF